MKTDSLVAGRPRGGAYQSGPYRWYVLLLLTLIYTSHAMDRAMPGILVEPVRHEFGLKDAELGLFTGVSFGIAFALAVLPMGFLSDRRGRRNFLAVILVLWSLCTALGGLARSYFQLVLTRFGVGATESGAAPIILPMLTDIFPADRRAFAMGLLYIGSPLGAFLASIMGGYVAAEHGWRAALLLAGAPGLLLAVLLLTTVKEPPRGGAQLAAQPPPKPGEVAAFLWRKPALVCLIIGGSLIGLVSIAMGAWSGSFFIRSHGLGLKETGLILGVGGGLSAMIAAPAYGWLADRLVRRAPHWPLTLAWVSALLAAASGFAMLFAPALAVAIAGFVAGDVFRAGYAPLIYSVLMEQTPSRMRGTVMSTVQLTTNLVGFGLGPLIIGALSDLYGGGAALRYAMANALGIFALVVVLLVTGSVALYGMRGQSRPQPAV